MSLRFVKVAALSLLVGCGAAACSRPDDYARRGDGYAAQGRLAEAIIEYRRAVQGDPRRGEFHSKLADLYDNDGDSRLAVDEAVKAADLLPSDVKANLRAGGMLLAAGAFEDAKTRANIVLTLDARSVDGQILLGNALAGLQDLDDALKEYEEAIAINPSADAAYTSIAEIRLVHGRSDLAEASFRKAVAVAPKSIGARMALANFLWSSGRNAEAEQALKDVLALDPKSTSANRALGVFYLTSHRAADAEPYFRAVAEITRNATAELMLADYYAYVHRFDDARRVLGGMTPTGPLVAATRTRLAAIDSAQGRSAQALTEMAGVVSQFPKDATAHLTNARLLHLAGRANDAIAQARIVAEDETNAPAAVEANLIIGTVQAERGHRADAEIAFETALRLRPQTVEAAVSLAQLALQDRNFDQAALRANQALAIRPGNRDARVLLIRASLGNNDVSAAQTAIAQLAREYPQWPPTWTLRAALELQSGQIDAARQSFAKAAALAPTDLDAQAGLVSIDIGTRRIADAVARIEDGLKAEKPSAAFFILAARTYVAANEPAKAEDVLKRAIGANPANLDAYSLLGQLYINQHRVAEARARFQQIAALDPQSVSAHTMLGMLLEADGKPADAEAEYLAALRVDARAAAAANNLAWLYADSSRNLDQALQLAQVAQQQLPTDPHVSDTLGWIYYRKKMPAEAIRSLEVSVTEDAADPLTHYHLGLACLLAGDRAKARTELQRAVDSKTEFAERPDARTALARLGGG